MLLSLKPTNQFTFLLCQNAHFNVIVSTSILIVMCASNPDFEIRAPDGAHSQILQNIHTIQLLEKLRDLAKTGVNFLNLSKLLFARLF